jgi:hypothetical protein
VSKYNAFAVTGINQISSALQKLWVRGHLLQQTKKRTITMKPVNWGRDQIPFAAKDE